MLVSVGLRVPTSAIASNENIGVPTRMSLNVRHPVISGASAVKCWWPPRNLFVC